MVRASSVCLTHEVHKKAGTDQEGFTCAGPFAGHAACMPSLHCYCALIAPSHHSGASSDASKLVCIVLLLLHITFIHAVAFLR